MVTAMRFRTVVVGVGALSTIVTLTLLITGLWAPIIAAVVPTTGEIAEAAEVAQEAEVANSAPQRRGGNRLRIAIIDDSLSVTDTLLRYLPSMIAGSNITAFPNCEVALATPDLIDYEVFIVDYDMKSAMNGAACTVALRARVPNALIIGNSSALVGKEFLEAGADAFLQKENLIKIADLILNLP
jgi:CheY-like chemotaxis protein